MRTYNALGVAEGKAGRLAEARGWYQRSRELAEQLHDQPSLGAVAQNLGIVCQLEGAAARERGDEPAARRYLKAALRSVEESRGVWQAQKDQPHEADSLGQLAQIHLLLGDLDAAERHAQAAREIRESIGLKEAYIDYDTLARIAQARGDTQTAEAWARKRDDLLAELQRRAGGGTGIPAQLLQALQQLARACARAGFGADQPQALGPAEEENLATLDGYPDPFPDLVAHLRELATGRLPSIPDHLPPSCASSWRTWPGPSASPASGVDEAQRIHLRHGSIDGFQADERVGKLVRDCCAPPAAMIALEGTCGHSRLRDAHRPGVHGRRPRTRYLRQTARLESSADQEQSPSWKP